MIETSDPLVSDRTRHILARLARPGAAADAPVAPQRRGVRTVPAAAALAALVLVALLSVGATYLAMRPGAAPARGAPVAMAPVAAAPDGIQLEASGYIVARNKASVSSDIIGRIRDIRVDVGDHVRRGDIIAMLDDREARLRLNAARFQDRQSELEQRSARVRLALEEARLRRQTELLGRGFTTRADFDAATANRDSARIAVDTSAVGRLDARNNIHSAAILVEKYVIRSPFDGIIVEVTARPGETVSPTTGGNSLIRTGLVLLVDPRDLYAIAEVPEAQLSRLRVGQPVNVQRTGTEQLFTARVGWISPVSSRQRGVVEVGIPIPPAAQPALTGEGAHVLDGMEVNVQFLHAAAAPPSMGIARG